MTHIAYAMPAQPVLPFHDSRTGLRVMGILIIVFGSFAALIALLTPLALVMPTVPGEPKPHVGEVLGGGAALLVMSAAIIWAGIGSVRLRRWSGPVVLASAGATLVLGVVTCLVMLALGPQIFRQLKSQGGPPAAAIFGVVFAGVFVVLLMIVVPAVLVWFYRRPDTRATLHYFDPTPRFTDGCPTPVLAIVIVLAWSATTWLAASVSRGVIPVFGTSLTGVAASAVNVLLAGVALGLAWMFFKLRPVAWPVAAVLLTVSYASLAVTQLVGDNDAALLRSGHKQEEIDAMKMFMPVNGPMSAIMTIAGLALMLAYLFYTRRFLTGASQPEAPEAPPTQTETFATVPSDSEAP